MGAKSRRLRRRPQAGYLNSSQGPVKGGISLGCADGHSNPVPKTRAGQCSDVSEDKGAVLKNVVVNVIDRSLVKSSIRVKYIMSIVRIPPEVARSAAPIRVKCCNTTVVIEWRVLARLNDPLLPFI